LVGKEKMGESFDELLDPLAPDDPQDDQQEWDWEEEAKHQKIRKRRLPEREDGGSSRKGRGPFRKRR
jgi:hypothetical protein